MALNSISCYQTGWSPSFTWLYSVLHRQVYLISMCWKILPKKYTTPIFMPIKPISATLSSKLLKNKTPLWTLQLKEKKDSNNSALDDYYFQLLIPISQDICYDGREFQDKLSAFLSTQEAGALLLKRVGYLPSYEWKAFPRTRKNHLPVRIQSTSASTITALDRVTCRKILDRSRLAV